MLFKNRWLFIALLFGLLAALPQYAQPGRIERDRTTERVEAGEDQYIRVTEAARDRLIDAINKAVLRAADQGELDKLEELETQRDAFENDSTLPASRAVRREALAYHRSMERAADDLVRIYERAIRAYTQDRRIDEARIIRTRMTMLEEGVSLEIVEFEGHRYALLTRKKSWHEAQEICESLGGYLVCVGSREENNFFQSMIPEGNGCWLGATDEEQEGDWQWVDGSDFTFDDWQNGQPDNHQNNQHHAWVQQGGQWDDFWSYDNAVTCFVCEWDGQDEDESNQD